MQDLPHFYTVEATAESLSNIAVNSLNLPSLEVAPPIGFNGPGDIWSPEDLLVSSVATCTILSFRAIARASKFDWISIECVAEGKLERIDGKTQFSKIVSKAKLVIAAGSNEERAVKLLNKAEQSCLISNSLSADCSIECEVVFQ